MKRLGMPGRDDAPEHIAQLLPGRRRSLRVRLLLLLLASFMTVWIATAIFTYFQTIHEVDEVYDAHLARSAGLVFGLFAHRLEERVGGGSNEVALVERLLTSHRYADRLEFRLWLRDTPLFHSSGFPLEQHSPLHSGYHHPVINGVEWLLYVSRINGQEVVVEVAERYDIRRRMIDEITTQALYPLLVIVPLLALIIWVGVGRGLSPLDRIASEVQRRSDRQLQPIDPAIEVPAEVVPLVHHLNQLLHRLELAMQRERRFTADASHELRTPLASLKTQAQVALRAAGEQERRHALGQILSGVDRATHLVEQLLTIARVEPGAEPHRMECVDLVRQMEEVISTGYSLAEEREVTIDLHHDDPPLLRGNAPLLAVMGRNLVENAIRYTPVGGRVSVSIRGSEDEVVLQVSDSGPGVGAGEESQIFERFYRGNNASGFGCGLGLSIVQRIVVMHQATIEVANIDPAGACFTIRFPVSCRGTPLARHHHPLPTTVPTRL